MRVILPALVSPRDFFDPLKSLLLFMTFQTPTPTIALGGGHHISFALIGRCYLPPAFSFRAPMLVRYFAFVTKVQCGLPYVLCPELQGCRPVTFDVNVILSRYQPEECPAWHFAVTLSISLLSLIAVYFIFVVYLCFMFTMQRYDNYL